MKKIKEAYIHKIFVLGILLKAFNGAAEILGGIALLFPEQAVGLIQRLIQHELIKDPHDFIAVRIGHLLPAVVGISGLFAVMYLLSHGIIKIFLAIGLIRGRLWAYPVALAVFMLFVAYQAYRFSFTHSSFLVVLTIFDIIVIWLTWHEYRFVRKRMRNP